MSKNVAVFVDVANIFYAAKAAGIDIDYVTLLKSATAGRDFVRAYAYTGLDPENDNQRQFHAFLSRSGYKVVSKDIRKYGDGRIKANLDIELVVDMMRMGEKLDIAVVVSGDGDFAPAIAAVQQMGVRVEVISFRGNTSSDLIDVADTFIDITSVAKVEKGARSGRRVAADGDLSMTEVPEKESGVTPRRRRRRGEEEEKAEKTSRSARRPRGAKRETVAQELVAEESTAEEPTPAGTTGLVALPGEKLSRRAGPDASAASPAEEAAEVHEASEVAASAAAGGEAGTEEGGGRRRRRRRGGRGRGRRAEEAGIEEQEPAADLMTAAGSDSADHLDEVPTLPQHSGFGSVWDSQLGTGSSGSPARSQASAADEEFEDEPEVPEYLLAEKRQQGRRRGGRGGRGGGYRSALDRERYGSGSRGSGYPGGSRGRGGHGSRAGQPSTQGRASSSSMEPIAQTAAGDPWSEVPPEIQELLRAELARRNSQPAGSAATSTPEAPPAEETPDAEGKAAAKPKRSTRRKSTAASTAEESPDAEGKAAAKPKRSTRRKSTAEETPDAEGKAAAKPKRSTRRKSTAASTAEESPDTEEA